MDFGRPKIIINNSSICGLRFCGFIQIVHNLLIIAIRIFIFVPNVCVGLYELFHTDFDTVKS